MSPLTATIPAWMEKSVHEANILHDNHSSVTYTGEAKWTAHLTEGYGDDGSYYVIDSQGAKGEGDSICRVVAHTKGDECPQCSPQQIACTNGQES